jgi:hypothetical protein
MKNLIASYEKIKNNLKKAISLVLEVNKLFILKKVRGADTINPSLTAFTS